jgi:hypothetical protein
MFTRYWIILPTILILVSPMPGAFSQVLQANTDQKSYTPGDTLLVSGKTFPNDALIAELFNPAGRRVLRTQIDVGGEGNFTTILMNWPEPNKDFPFDVYTLKLTSSVSKEEKFLVFRFTDIPIETPGEERRLGVNLSVPPAIGKDETAKIIVELSINGVLVKGDAKETLEGSRIYYPDGNTLPIDNFIAIDDGIYLADFRSDIVGHHVIHVQAFHQGLLASSAQGIFVEEGSVLSLGKEIRTVNENLEKLRGETIERNLELANAVDNVSRASGQVTSLLLPVFGMVAVIIALQATILTRRSRPNNE